MSDQLVFRCGGVQNINNTDQENRTMSENQTNNDYTPPDPYKIDLAMRKAIGDLRAANAVDAERVDAERVSFERRFIAARLKAPGASAAVIHARLRGDQ